MSTRNVFLLEVDGYTDVSTFTTQRYVMGSPGGYRTKPTDSPANTLYKNVVLSLGALTQEMFDGTVSRQQPSSGVGFGNAVIQNIDGEFDSVYGLPATTSFRERPARILMVQEGAAYSTAVVVQKALVTQAEVRQDQVVLHLVDPLYTFESPHLTTRYLGNNALPAGVEGSAELLGKIKPYLRGRAYQIEPYLVNTSKLIYQVCTNALTSATMYDQGASSVFTVGAAYVSQADMEATAPAAGQVRYWLAGGMFRLGSRAVGKVTVDAVADSSGNSTAAQLLKSFAIAKGVSSGDISAADVTALDTANSAVLGIWIDDDRTTRAIMDAIAGSVGAYYGFDRLSVLRMARLELPSGTSAQTLANWNVRTVESVATGEDIPTTTVILNYARYQVTQSGTDLSTSLSAVTVADLGQEWRTTTTTSTPSPNPYKRANTLERDTLLAFKADADTEASRLNTLFGTPRRTFTLSDVQLDAASILSLSLNAVVELRWPRYGFGDGVTTGGLVRIIAIPRKDLTTNSCDLTVWCT